MGWLQSILDAIRGRPPRPTPGPSPIPPPHVPPPPPALPAASELVGELNARRAGLGLPPLADDVKLHRVALDWAEEMAAARVLTHGEFSSRVSPIYPGHQAAEDIAMGRMAAGACVDMWMGSAPHRANILGPYSLVGVGIATSRDGELWWVADFVRS